MVLRVTHWRLPLLSDLPGVAHLFAGRLDAARPDPASLTPLLAAGLIAESGAALPLSTVRQVHSSVCLEAPSTPGEAGSGDALVTSSRGRALGIATADCLPIVACDPDAGVLAAVHAGWRGTVAGVLETALDAMAARGARASRIRIGVGPGVGRCCYAVGTEVREAFSRAAPSRVEAIFWRKGGGPLHLDLLEANRLAALERGIVPGHFAALGICTVCRHDVCHSYRVDGTSAGRMWLLAALV
jgi:YfiH family protein